MVGRMSSCLAERATFYNLIFCIPEYLLLILLLLLSLGFFQKIKRLVHAYEAAENAPAEQRRIAVQLFNMATDNGTRISPHILTHLRYLLEGYVSIFTLAMSEELEMAAGHVGGGSAPFSTRRVASEAHEIIDQNGKVIGWAIDSDHAACIVAGLEQITAEHDYDCDEYASATFEERFTKELLGNR